MDGFEPTTEGQRPPWKTIAIIAGAVVIGVAIIVGVVLFVRSRRSVAIDEQNLSRLETQLEQSLEGCAQEPDPAACREEKVRAAAAATGAASLCEELEGTPRDDCVWSVAQDQRDPEECLNISDEAVRQRCYNSLQVAMAAANDDMTACDKVIDEAWKEECRRNLSRPGSADECYALGRDESECADYAAVEAARSAQDPDLCQAVVSQVLRDDCIDKVGIGDRDFDGLDAGQEALYGSSDTNPDTDGDGYRDGDEVAAGYSPVGSGRLE
jgi:hypothetical protein